MEDPDKSSDIQNEDKQEETDGIDMCSKYSEVLKLMNNYVYLSKPNDGFLFPAGSETDI